MPHSLIRHAANRIASPVAGVLAFAGLLLLSGCGGKGVKLGEVSGQVTFNGKPLPKAVVAFEPLGGGRPSIGQTDDQGRYELVYLRDIRGALVGKHRVKIGKEGGPASARLPDKYNKNSVLEEEVKAGRNVIDFPLTSGLGSK